MYFIACSCVRIEKSLYLLCTSIISSSACCTNSLFSHVFKCSISVANANSVEYGYKTATTCDNSGWSCLGAKTGVGQIDTIHLNAGDSIFILVNARTTSITSQTFLINCGTTSITNNQTQPILFSLYPNPFSTHAKRIAT